MADFAIVSVDSEGFANFAGMFANEFAAQFAARHLENPRICEVVWRDDLKPLVFEKEVGSVM